MIERCSFLLRSGGPTSDGLWQSLRRHTTGSAHEAGQPNPCRGSVTIPFPPFPGRCRVEKCRTIRMFRFKFMARCQRAMPTARRWPRPGQPARPGQTRLRGQPVSGGFCGSPWRGGEGRERAGRREGASACRGLQRLAEACRRHQAVLGGARSRPACMLCRLGTWDAGRRTQGQGVGLSQPTSGRGIRIPQQLPAWVSAAGRRQRFAHCADGEFTAAAAQCVHTTCHSPALDCLEVKPHRSQLYYDTNTAAQVPNGAKC